MWNYSKRCTSALKYLLEALDDTLDKALVSEVYAALPQGIEPEAITLISEAIVDTVSVQDQVFIMGQSEGGSGQPEYSRLTSTDCAYLFNSIPGWVLSIREWLWWVPLQIFR